MSHCSDVIRGGDSFQIREKAINFQFYNYFMKKNEQNGLERFRTCRRTPDLNGKLKDRILGTLNNNNNNLSIVKN